MSGFDCCSLQGRHSAGPGQRQVSSTSMGIFWIAKFPRIKDRFDVGAWELVIAKLAERGDIRVPACDARTFTGAGHTFLVRRFDRRESGKRVHFASAMTLTAIWMVRVRPAE